MEQNGGEAGEFVDSIQPRQAEPNSAAEELAAQLYERYSERLLAVARRLLGRPLQSKIDPEDVLQSVFRCFLERVGRNQYTWPNDGSLWCLLLRLTQSKCSHKRRYYRAACRDVRREREAHAAVTENAERAAWNSSRQTTSPAELAALADVIAEVERRLSTPTKRRIFELSLLGHTVVEISTETGYYERGVERVRAEIRQLLLTLLAGGDPAEPLPQCV